MEGCDQEAPMVECGSAVVKGIISDIADKLFDNLFWKRLMLRTDEEDDGMIGNPYPTKAFIPYKGICGFTVVEEDKEESPIPGLSLITLGIKNPVRGNILLTKTISNSRLLPCSSPNAQQTSRKQRRC
uniref:Uncharacterized protein n=1 Tax=Lactuca sativa TaxID=4236 RepID=A0A9R1VT38_LACSA|nr:hypothetical protein LSAT_V11C400227630 [Lactuca sativa]